MNITSAQAGYYRIPLPVVLSDSTHGEMTHFELITVRLLDGEGEEGIGYTYTVGRGGSAIRKLLERELLPFLIGTDSWDVERLWEEMWWRLHWMGRGGVVVFAISAIDIALWDLCARRLGRRLWQVLGGESNQVKAYAGGIDLLFSLDALCSQAEDFTRRCFRAIKMKVRQERLSEDVERVRAMRQLLGPDITLMVDANMCWAVDEAIRAARALKELNLCWLEEPTASDDFDGHSRIAREGGLPIAAGENLRTLHEFQQMISRGSISFPMPDCSNIGGMTAWMKVAEMANKHGLPVTSHGVPELHVHLLAAVPNASYLEDHGFGMDRFMKQALQFEDGKALAARRPGHGVDFQCEALKAHGQQP